jgi:hypothetical protein
VQQLHHQPLDDRLLMDFLGGQPLGLQQGIKRLVVLAPLPIALGEVQQVVGAARGCPDRRGTSVAAWC